MRLGALFGGLALVLAAQQRLDEPATHQAIGRLLGDREPTPGAARPIAPTEAPRALGDEALSTIRDNTPFRDEEQTAWFDLFRALQQDHDHADPGVGLISYAQFTGQPEAYRARQVTVTGTVRRVERVEPAENSLGLEALHRVILEPPGGVIWPITVYAIDPVPTELIGAEAYATGFFFKNLSYRWSEGVGVTPVIVAQRLRSEAPEAAPSLSGVERLVPELALGPLDPQDSLGRSLLRQLGVDPSALDLLEDRRSLTFEERDAFYALLDAVSQTPASQLARLAQSGLGDYAARQQDLAHSDRDRLVAREVARLADEGRYSVAPLFGDGAAQRGELVVFDALVRRAVRVIVESSGGEPPPIDHYWEIEAFTDDSQNLPLVFCVRELPEGFPTGEAIRQPARIAGFFFKQWAYQPRSSGGERNARAFAPLLIGRAPVPIDVPSPTRPGWVVGAVGVSLLVAVAVWIWSSARSDEAYDRQTLDRLRNPDERDFSHLP